MGYGDFKLFAALGAWLGWQMLLPVILFAAASGAVLGMLLDRAAAPRAQRADSVRPLPRGRRLARDDVAAPSSWPRGGSWRTEPPMAAPLRIGLTGGIASGKSAVASAFERLGVPIIDTDRLAREVVEPGRPALAAVVRAFGPEVLGADGRLDRRALRARVFADEGLRRRLEAILHPAIRAATRRRGRRRHRAVCRDRDSAAGRDRPAVGLRPGPGRRLPARDPARAAARARRRSRRRRRGDPRGPGEPRRRGSPLPTT